MQINNLRVALAAEAASFYYEHTRAFDSVLLGWLDPLGTGARLEGFDTFVHETHFIDFVEGEYLINTDLSLPTILGMYWEGVISGENMQDQKRIVAEVVAKQIEMLIAELDCVVLTYRGARLEHLVTCVPVEAKPQGFSVLLQRLLSDCGEMDTSQLVEIAKRAQNAEFGDFIKQFCEEVLDQAKADREERERRQRIATLLA